MVELENYIYFDICIFALEEYEKRDYKMKQSSFRYFCVMVEGEICLFRTKRSKLGYLLQITKKIRLIYGLREDAAFNYVIDFFIEKKYERFDEAARSMLHYFRNSFC